MKSRASFPHRRPRQPAFSEIYASSEGLWRLPASIRSTIVHRSSRPARSANWRVEVKSKSYLYRYVLCLITYPNPIPLFIEAQPRPEGPPLQSQSLLVCHARFVRRVSYSARFQKQSATSIKMTRRCCEIEAFRLRNGFPSSSVLLLRSPRLQCRPA